MTEMLICARCHSSFEREIQDVDSEHATGDTYLVEPEPVCDECEHGFLSWLGCPPLC
jgi:hypothetical protein